MPLSNHTNDTLNESSSLANRASQGHSRTLTFPDHHQQPAAYDRNNAPDGDRERDRHTRTHRRFNNPFTQFFRRDDPAPAASDSSSIESNYRILPLLIGCIIPVSILINVPSISSPWVGLASYNETLHDWNDPEVVEIPHWLNGIIISALVMAILCNICVLSRFLERHVYRSVVLSLVTATIQDVLCICAVVPFGILYPPSKGYVYLEGFWSMIASIIFSFLATALITIDFHRTPNFRLQGSGVTHKQRILIAEAMSLCFYLAIGALIIIYIEKWTFLDALFFVMVTITTIGFGDRVPVTTGGRIFVVVYAAGGIVLLALAVNAIRYVILEDLHRRFAVRAKERKAKRDARRQERRNQRARQEEQRLRLNEAMERLQQMGVAQAPVDPGASTLLGTPRTKPSPSVTASDAHYFTHFPRHFNAAIGNPLRLPSLFTRSISSSEPKPIDDNDARQHGASDMTPADNPSQDAVEMMRTPGSNISREESAGASANAVSSDTQAGANLRRNPYVVDDDLLRYATTYPLQSHNSSRGRSWLDRLWFFRQPPPQETMPLRTLEEQREADKIQAYRESMEEYQRRLRFSAAMFLTFWLVGAIIFTFVESWDFGPSVYFVFVAFTTIGYGDLVPRTMAGRSIFLAYCLVGVVTLTSLASLIAEVLSKSMRKHVVESQLRRSERLEAVGDEPSDHRNDNVDLEQGIHHADTGDTGAFSRRASGNDDPDSLATHTTEQEDKTVLGTLQNVVKVSKSFDEMLRKILGLENTDDVQRAITSSVSRPRTPSLLVNSNPLAIVSYLESEEDESEPSFLSPSISRDITSTSSIHRHSLRPMLHQRRHSHGPQVGGTFHGSGSTLQYDPNRLQITAWPTTGTPSNVSRSQASPSNASRSQASPSDVSRSQASTPPPGLLQVPPSVSTFVSAPQNTKEGMITVPAIQWQSMIEYSKRFKALTVACEKALEKITEWEASEKRLRQRQCEARLLQKRRIDEFRKKLREQRRFRGMADDGMEEEEELEELDEWDEEGSEDEEDDEDLDNQRARIAAELLGPIPCAIPRTQSSPGQLRRLSHRRSISPDAHHPRPPSTSLERTPHAHPRHHHRHKSKDGGQAYQHHQDQVVEQSRAKQAIDTRRHVLLDELHRSESPEAMESSVASSPKEDGTVGSSSSSA